MTDSNTNSATEHRLTVRTVLDRVWTGMVGVAFVIMVPIFLIEWVQDFGLATVGLVILGLFLFGMARAWPSTG